jgi:hypothetical protein
MTRKKAVQALLAGAGQVAECKAKRQAWVRETAAALRAAQRAMDDRCMAAVERLSEEAFDRLVDEEQAKVCAILDQLNAVRDQDKWPPHLYFGGL